MLSTIICRRGGVDPGQSARTTCGRGGEWTHLVESDRSQRALDDVGDGLRREDWLVRRPESDARLLERVRRRQTYRSGSGLQRRILGLLPRKDLRRAEEDADEGGDEGRKATPRRSLLRQRRVFQQKSEIRTCSRVALEHACHGVVDWRKGMRVSVSLVQGIDLAGRVPSVNFKLRRALLPLPPNAYPYLLSSSTQDHRIVNSSYRGQSLLPCLLPSYHRLCCGRGADGNAPRTLQPPPRTSSSPPRRPVPSRPSQTEHPTTQTIEPSDTFHRLLQQEEEMQAGPNRA